MMEKTDEIDFEIRDSWFNIFKNLKRMELDDEVNVEILIDWKDRRNNFTVPKGTRGVAVAIFPGNNEVLVKLDMPDLKASLGIPVNFLNFEEKLSGLTLTVGNMVWSCPAIDEKKG
jgi:hypothetical protein